MIIIWLVTCKHKSIEWNYCSLPKTHQHTNWLLAFRRLPLLCICSLVSYTLFLLHNSKLTYARKSNLWNLHAVTLTLADSISRDLYIHNVIIDVGLIFCCCCCCSSPQYEASKWCLLNDMIDKSINWLYLIDAWKQISSSLSHFKPN